jgi:hypothetical protein
MDLTPEDRKRIYEEEKARMEAEALPTPPADPAGWTPQRLAPEYMPLTATERADLSNTRTDSAPTRIPLPMPAKLAMLGALAMVAYIAAGLFSSNTGTYSYLTNATPAPVTYPAIEAYEKAHAAVVEAEARGAELRNGAVVQPGWKWEIDGEYDHLRGSVKNATAQTVGYWAVTAKFVKKGSETVIDSAFTNGGQPLMPGESKQFEIMHRNIPGTLARIETSDVRFTR